MRRYFFLADLKVVTHHRDGKVSFPWHEPSDIAIWESVDPISPQELQDSTTSHEFERMTINKPRRGQ